MKSEPFIKIFTLVVELNELLMKYDTPWSLKCRVWLILVRGT